MFVSNNHFYTSLALKLKVLTKKSYYIVVINNLDALKVGYEMVFLYVNFNTYRYV
jgi:hypothetical protein